MKYDFTTLLNRKGHDALALDVLPIKDVEVDPNFSTIPMWVADMNYPVFENIQKQMIERINEPHFGYFEMPEDYYKAIQFWQKETHGIDVEKEAIGYENGVLGILSSALEAFSASGEPILVQSPCYIGFIHTLNNLGRKIIDSPLKKEDNWAMDYEDIEKKIIKHNIHFAIFCSPHNPTGRVWKKEEIQKFMDAPSKTFNLAGLVGSYHIVYDKYLRDRLNKQASLSHYNSPNILSVHALMGAYCKEGLDWVNELNEVISNNIDYALDFIHNNFKGIEVIKPEGTYMLYLDCTKYLDTHDITMDELLKKGVHYGVCWQDGRPFMNPNTIRMNLALPTILVEEAFSRLKKFVF